MEILEKMTGCGECGGNLRAPFRQTEGGLLVQAGPFACDRCGSRESAVRRALYFGCWGGLEHFLRDKTRQLHMTPPEGCPWDLRLMDGGLLKNGKVRDVYDGRVFWTCGGRDAMWFAFFWWDNSVDQRGASNSGFYVSGFKSGEAAKAFEFACGEFPEIVARQHCLLVLQT